MGARRLDVAVPLGELARALDWPVEESAATRPIRGIASLEAASPGDVSFLSSGRYAAAAAGTAAAAVLVRDADRHALPAGTTALVVADPYLAFARLTQWFAERIRRSSPAVGVHRSALLGEGVQLGRDVRIGPGVIVGDRARVGSGAVLGPGTVLGDETSIGDATHLTARVTVYDGCLIGGRCLVHAGTVIGSDGFGFAPDGGRWVKIAQLGSVQIGADVEIGANCSIDRGALDDTVIEDGCKLDNLIQVGHNVRIGANSAIAGCVGIAGSAQIGARCRIGGGAGILGHLAICDDVVISAMSLVTRSIRRPGFYSGIFPLMENAQWERAAATLRQLPDLRARLRHLESLTKEGA